jgi:hypothetical protein
MNTPNVSVPYTFQLFSYIIFTLTKLLKKYTVGLRFLTLQVR